MVQWQGNLLSCEEKDDISKKLKSLSFTILSMGGVCMYITAHFMKHTNWRSNQHHPLPTPLKHEPEKLAYFAEKFLKAFLWSHNYTSVRLYLPKDDLI